LQHEEPLFNSIKFSVFISLSIRYAPNDSSLEHRFHLIQVPIAFGFRSAAFFRASHSRLFHLSAIRNRREYKRRLFSKWLNFNSSSFSRFGHLSKCFFVCAGAWIAENPFFSTIKPQLLLLPFGQFKTENCTTVCQLSPAQGLRAATGSVRRAAFAGGPCRAMHCPYRTRGHRYQVAAFRYFHIAILIVFLINMHFQITQKARFKIFHYESRATAATDTIINFKCSNCTSREEAKLAPDRVRGESEHLIKGNDLLQ
jgi:hypothetical protein